MSKCLILFFNCLESLLEERVEWERKVKVEIGTGGDRYEVEYRLQVSVYRIRNSVQFAMLELIFLSHLVPKRNSMSYIENVMDFHF